MNNYLDSFSCLYEATVPLHQVSCIKTFCSTLFELAGVTGVQHIISVDSRFKCRKHHPTLFNNINIILSYNVIAFQSSFAFIVNKLSIYLRPLMLIPWSWLQFTAPIWSWGIPHSTGTHPVQFIQKLSSLLFQVNHNALIRWDTTPTICLLIQTSFCYRDM